MTPSILENYLDEFSTRYLESCEEIYASQTRTGMLLSRLSSPLSVMDIDEPTQAQASDIHTVDVNSQYINPSDIHSSIHSSNIHTSDIHSSNIGSHIGSHIHSPEIIRPHFSRPVPTRYTVESDSDQISIFSTQSSPIEPGFSPQSSISSTSSISRSCSISSASSMSSSGSPSEEITSTVCDRTFTKLNIVRPKTKGKLLRGTTNVGNPFYNRKGSIIRKNSCSSLNSR